MLGNMMQGQLLISGLIEHAEAYHADAEIVSRTVEGPIHRYTFSDAARRSRQLANALTKLGLEKGDTIGTLAWNTYRHFELYFGVSGIGCVVNTVNPRLFPEQLTYIINHADNKYLFIDLSFVELLESISASLNGIKGVVILTDNDSMPETTLENVICYEDLIAAESEDFFWPEFDENTASSLCYTSGTTGDPKGVLYSHRSTILHAWIVSTGNVANVSSSTVILPVVPMFHVNAWGIPYAAAMLGAKLVFPGPALDGASVFELIDSEKPDLLMGVPTVWLGLLQYLKETNQTLDSVKNALVGGAAAPRAMIKEFEEKHDVFLMHGWGMTEMSPLGTATSRTAAMDDMDVEDRYDLQQKQGKAFFGLEMTIADDEGNELPKDGVAFGRLLVKGPTIVERYYKSNQSAMDANGWFDTGDVAKIHPEGYMEIVDRSKDVIKSGGEWISSIDLENTAVGHPGVGEACVIGVLHKKWDERPVLLIVKAVDANPTKDDILGYLKDKVAKWWLPDDVIFVNELPKDGVAFGRLLVKGPTIVERYFKSNQSAMDANGWFDTGDVAKIHPEGYMEIVDRSKDVIKSGGEWISSIDLENTAVGHPGVGEACVIGVLHEKWDERPVLLIVKAANADPTKDDILGYLEDKVAKWWLPDDVIFVNELPHTATGKLLKTNLRDEYKNYLINK